MGHTVSTLEYFILYGYCGLATLIILFLVSSILTFPALKAFFQGRKNGTILMINHDGTGEFFPIKYKDEGKKSTLELPPRYGLVFGPTDLSATIRVAGKLNITPYLEGLPNPVPPSDAAACSQLSDEMQKDEIPVNTETVHAMFYANCNRKLMLPSSSSRIPDSLLFKMSQFIHRIRDGLCINDKGVIVDETEPLELVPESGIFSFLKASIFMSQQQGHTSKSLKEHESVIESIALDNANQGLGSLLKDSTIKYAFAAVVILIMLMSFKDGGGISSII